MSSATLPAFATRRARIDDLPALQVIYNFYSVTTGSVIGDPPSLEARLKWFDAHFTADGPHQMWVAHGPEDRLAFAWSLPYGPDPSAVVTSIFCAPHATGLGIGTRLYTDLLDAIRPYATAAYAGIALPNPASVALHRKLGFVAQNIQRAYANKLGRDWDLGWFSLDLGGSPPAR